MALTFEIVITIVFWTFLFNPDQPVSLAYYYTRLVHSTPLLLLLLEFMANRFLFRLEQLPILLIPGVAYIVVNYGYTKITGNPVYKILTWDSATSYYMAGGISLLYIIGFCIVYFISYE